MPHVMFEGTSITTAESVRVEGRALRAIGWNELAARINAARDLRHVLRRDHACLGASFGDAAAGYFAALEDSKPTVNPDALEHRKSDDCMDASSRGDAAEGDREI